MSKQEDRQTIEHLQQRYEEFKSKKVKFETQRDAAEAELENLKMQAKELYGSDDIEKLEEILAVMKRENEKKRSDYQAALDQIDEGLAEVETKFQGR